MKQTFVVTILDCAIKNPSTPCIQRLTDHFTNLKWQVIDATKCSQEDYDRALSSDIFIIFGSHSNVEDRLPWQHALSEFMYARIQAGAPTLGLCFGHQLMADRYGGEVVKRVKGAASGPREVLFTDNFGIIKENQVRTLGVSHSYEVSKIPQCFEVFATSKDCPTDGLKHKELPYYGFQAHPEASESFFLNECPQMQISERSVVMDQGLSVIEGFLQIALKVLA